MILQADKNHLSSSSANVFSFNDHSVGVPDVLSDQPVINNTVIPTTAKEESKREDRELLVTPTMVSSLIIIPLGITETNWHQCHITLNNGKEYKGDFLPEDVNKLLKSINSEITNIAPEDQEDLMAFGLSSKSAEDILTKAFAQKLQE